jgi:hypothetical protein
MENNNIQYNSSSNIQGNIGNAFLSTDDTTLNNNEGEKNPRGEVLYNLR